MKEKVWIIIEVNWVRVSYEKVEHSSLSLVVIVWNMLFIVSMGMNLGDILLVISSCMSCKYSQACVCSNVSAAIRWLTKAV